jgi:hypothetical protein
MNLPLYVIAQFIVLLLVIGLMSSVFVGLSKTLRRIQTPAIQRDRLLHYTLTVLLGWLLILALTPVIGLGPLESAPALLLLILFFLPTGLLLSLFAWPAVRRLLLLVDGRWLIRIQGFRIITELMLWMGYLAGFAPLQMTFGWLNYDIIVGLSAIMGSYVFFLRGPRRPEIIIWNTFGLVSLLYWLFIAMASLPDDHWQLFRTHIDSSFLLEVPFVWLIGFVYPLAVWMHVGSVGQLFINRKKKEHRFQSFSKHIKKKI